MASLDVAPRSSQAPSGAPPPAAARKSDYDSDATAPGGLDSDDGVPPPASPDASDSDEESESPSSPTAAGTKRRRPLRNSIARRATTDHRDAVRAVKAEHGNSSIRLGMPWPAATFATRQKLAARIRDFDAPPARSISSVIAQLYVRMGLVAELEAAAPLTGVHDLRRGFVVLDFAQRERGSDGSVDGPDEGVAHEVGSPLSVKVHAQSFASALVTYMDSFGGSPPPLTWKAVIRLTHGDVDGARKSVVESPAAAAAAAIPASAATMGTSFQAPSASAPAFKDELRSAPRTRSGQAPPVIVASARTPKHLSTASARRIVSQSAANAGSAASSRLPDIERELAEIEARRAHLLRAREETAARERRAAAKAADARDREIRAMIKEHEAAKIEADKAAVVARNRAESNYALAVERAGAKRTAALEKASQELAATLAETSAELSRLTAELAASVEVLSGISDITLPLLEDIAPESAAGEPAGSSSADAVAGAARPAAVAPLASSVAASEQRHEVFDLTGDDD